MSSGQIDLEDAMDAAMKQGSAEAVRDMGSSRNWAWPNRAMSEQWIRRNEIFGGCSKFPDPVPCGCPHPVGRIGHK